ARSDRFCALPPRLAAIASYVGAVVWLYEKPRAGIAALAVVSGLSLWGAWTDAAAPSMASSTHSALAVLEIISSGLVVGLMMAAMFLGHWYLNSPTMALAPLQRLI